MPASESWGEGGYSSDVAKNTNLEFCCAALGLWLGGVGNFHGRILPSASAKEEFLKSRGRNAVPEGYVIEHKIPLYAGGRDEPSNMELATRDEHRAKMRMDYQLFGK